MFDVDFHILNQKATPAIYADTLADRPAAGFAGRLFVATDSPYGVFRDTGSAWVQVASNGGGGGTSTGVNGLNGTTNIGLGGTLANDTTILGGGGNDLNLGLSDSDRIGLFSIYSINWDWKNKNTDGISSIYADSNVLELKFDDVSALPGNTSINLARTTIRSYFNGGRFGLGLDDSSGLFSLGDYDKVRKYNSINVDDNNDRIYFTSTWNQANNDQDMLYASNNPGANERFIKLGDFNGYVHNTSLTIDDQNYRMFTSGSNGNNIGFDFDFFNSIYLFGETNSLISCTPINNTIEFLTTNLKFTGVTTSSSGSALIPQEFIDIVVNGQNRKIQLFG
jgi:hypothetical protein